MSSTNFAVTTHHIPSQHIRGYPRSTASETDELQLAIKQYTPLSNPTPKDGDITLIAAHANGVVKELYEPLWDDLLQRAGDAGIGIRAIWIADIACQGESGVLNEDFLGNEQSWYDHPRDLLYAINHFRAEMKPPLFGMGHSMGGNNVANLALIHPRLFTGLILIDPVIQPSAAYFSPKMPAFASAFRRDIWPSREDAAASFRKNAFYRAWDPRVLACHIQYSLRDLPTSLYPDVSPAVSGSSKAKSLVSAAATNAAPSLIESPNSRPVALTTTKHQEVFAFFRAKMPLHEEPSAEALAEFQPPRRLYPDVPEAVRGAGLYRPEPFLTALNMPQLRPRTLFIFPESDSVIPAPGQVQLVDSTGTGVGGSGGKTVEDGVKSVIIARSGHFVAFEQPTVVAEQVAGWLSEELRRWKSDTASDRAAWEAIKQSNGGRGRMTMSPEYLAWMKWLRDDSKTKQKQTEGSGSKL